MEQCLCFVIYDKVLNLMDPIWVYVFVEIDGFDGVNACVMVNGRM
jgi:hypothetical protein